MSQNKIVFILISAVLLLGAQGCTSRAWYEGLRENQRQDCYRYSNESAIQQCLERVDGMTYDRYQTEREAAVSETE